MTTLHNPLWSVGIKGDHVYVKAATEGGQMIFEQEFSLDSAEKIGRALLDKAAEQRARRNGKILKTPAQDAGEPHSVPGGGEGGS